MNEKILLIIVGNIGDVIRATPTLRELHKMYGVKVDVVTSLAAKFIFENNPYCNEIYIDRKYSRLIRKSAISRFQKNLKRNMYTKIYLLNPDSKYLDLINVIRNTSTAVTAYTRNYTESNASDSFLDYTAYRNAIVHFLALLGKDDNPSFDNHTLQMDLVIDKKYLNKVMQFENCAILHCETTIKKPYRGINLCKLKKTVAYLQERYDKVILTGTKNARSNIKHFIASLENQEGIYSFVGKDIRELAALISVAKIVICPCTGVFHLARALKTPVLGVYGPTDSNLNGGIGAGIYGEAEFSCEKGPCFDNDDSYDRYSPDCLNAKYAPCLANLEENTIINRISNLEETINNKLK